MCGLDVDLQQLQENSVLVSFLCVSLTNPHNILFVIYRLSTALLILAVRKKMMTTVRQLAAQIEK